LAALTSQTVDFGQFEVVVVSDGATDGTDEFLRAAEHPYRVVFEAQANKGPAAARNKAVSLASGELLLFLDDDVVASPTLIEQHLATHAAEEGQLVVVGPMLDPPGYRRGSCVRWEQAMLYKQYEAMQRGDFSPTYRQFYTGNASVERRFLLDAGGFDERYLRAEDVELAYRLHVNGARFVFNERAIGYHYAVRPFGSWIRNARLYGKNDVIFDREHGFKDRMDAARWEYRRRHALTRSLTRSCIGRSWLEFSLHWPVRVAVTIAEWLRLEEVANTTLSALYNTAYYCGMADELGGPQAFHDFMEQRV
jgi:GT2 family glycosyltransferase